jgi:hypothetical protein
MSLASNLAAPSQQLESATTAYAGWRACIIVLAMFILAATLATVRKDVTFVFDEIPHLSYVAYLQHSHEVWPTFSEMWLIDPSNFRFTNERNYLDHPSIYYWLMAWLGPDLEGHPDAVLFYRLFNIALAAIGLAAWMAIGIVLRLPPLKLYAYILPLACIPVLATLAGTVTNDNMAFAGSGIAALAIFQLLITRKPVWLMTALAGVIIASWAKFPPMLQTGGLVGVVLIWMLWQRRLDWRWIAPSAIAALIAGAPYIVFFVQYGSPAPRTPGQIEMFTHIAQASGWTDAPRLSPVSFAMTFLWEFIVDWMPVERTRSALAYAALAIPVATALCALAGVALSAQRVARAEAEPLDVIVVSGGIAFAVTFMLHMIFSYRLHIDFGWMTSAYPRYYLPLLPILPLANLMLLDTLDTPRARTLLLVLLIAGPMIFRVAGASYG